MAHDITPVEILAPEGDDDTDAAFERLLAVMASIVERHFHEQGQGSSMLESDMPYSATG